MFKPCWVLVAAVMLLFAASGSVDAQQTSSPTLESQPIAPTEGSNSSGNHNDDGAEKKPDTENLVPAIEKIESAIRDLIPKPDEAKNQWAEDREKADLQAQEDMAFWAKAMTFATWASVAVTVMGLYLIWRTLHHTKIAAGHTEGMLVEAKAATKAANLAAESADRQANLSLDSFRRLERPYLHVEVKEVHMYRGIYDDDKGLHEAALDVTNHGKSPAILQAIDFILEDEPRIPLNIPLGLTVDVYEIILPGEKMKTQVTRKIKNRKENVAYTSVACLSVIGFGKLVYADQMGTIHTDHFRLRCTDKREFMLDGDGHDNRRESNYHDPTE